MGSWFYYQDTRSGETRFLPLTPVGRFCYKEPVKQIDSLELPTGVLKIISPTDCVKDRLAAYYYWKDLQSLEQAAMVAASQPIDLEEIERWSANEGMLAKFRKIVPRLSRD